MHLPLRTERNDILWHGILREAVVAESNHIGLFRNEMHSTILIDKPHGNDVVALTQQTLGNIVATRRILIVGMSDFLAVQVGYVLVEQGAQQEAGRLSRVFLIYINMLTEPDGADTTPHPIVLVDRFPVCVFIRGKLIS